MTTGRPPVPARRATLHRPMMAGAAALLGAFLTAGCVPGYHAGGSLASRDLFTYPSEPNWPQTVKLVDHRTGAVLWSVDIPVGQQLVVRFYEDQTDDPQFPAMMRWELMPLGKKFGQLDNAMPVPSRLSRRLDTYVRPYEPEGGYTGDASSPAPASAPKPAAEPPAAEPAAPTEPPAPELDLPSDAE